MNFEERMDRLTERHEALAQSVELLYRQSEKHDKQLEQQRVNIDRVLTAVESLVAIVQSHERRLGDLEQ